MYIPLIIGLYDILCIIGITTQFLGVPLGSILCILLYINIRVSTPHTDEFLSHMVFRQAGIQPSVGYFRIFYWNIHLANWWFQPRFLAPTNTLQMGIVIPNLVSPPIPWGSTVVFGTWLTWLPQQKIMKMITMLMCKLQFSSILRTLLKTTSVRPQCCVVALIYTHHNGPWKNPHSNTQCLWRIRLL